MLVVCLAIAPAPVNCVDCAGELPEGSESTAVEPAGYDPGGTNNPANQARRARIRLGASVGVLGAGMLFVPAGALLVFAGAVDATAMPVEGPCIEDCETSSSRSPGFGAAGAFLIIAGIGCIVGGAIGTAYHGGALHRAKKKLKFDATGGGVELHF